MKLWQYLLMAAPLAILLPMIRFAVIKRRRRLEQDFTRRLETLLLPKETVKVICPSRQGRWVLTSTRLLLEAGEGFIAIPFRKIRSLRGVDETGKTTASPGKMASVTVKADSEHTLRSASPEFVPLVKGLKAQLAKKKKPAKKAVGKGPEK